MEASTLPGKTGEAASPRPQRKTVERVEPELTAGQAVAKAGRGQKLNDEQAQDALEWFLQADDSQEVEPKSLKLNMGNADKPEWISWVIGPVEDTLITKIREQSRKGTRAQKRRGDAEIDDMLVARRMVVEGTLEPDLRSLAKSLRMADPADAVQAFFKKRGKTGLITQLSGEILSISGWDEEDVQEVEAARG